MRMNWLQKKWQRLLMMWRRWLNPGKDGHPERQTAQPNEIDNPLPEGQNTPTAIKPPRIPPASLKPVHPLPPENQTPSLPGNGTSVDHQDAARVSPHASESPGMPLNTRSVAKANSRRNTAPGSGHRTFMRIDLAHRETITQTALRKITEGADSFNAWRRHRQFEPLWLRGLDWRNRDLRYLQWRGCVLVDVDLRHADLRGADLTGAVLHRVNMRDCKLGPDTSPITGKVNTPADDPPLDVIHLPGRGANPWLLPQATLSFVPDGRMRNRKDGTVAVGIKLKHDSASDLTIEIILRQGGKETRCLEAVIPPGAWYKKRLSLTLQESATFSLTAVASGVRGRPVSIVLSPPSAKAAAKRKRAKP